VVKQLAEAQIKFECFDGASKKLQNTSKVTNLLKILGILMAKSKENQLLLKARELSLTPKKIKEY